MIPRPTKESVRVKRVVVLGRGGSGKSTAARQLSARTGLPVIELDQYFWKPGLVATPRDEWVTRQRVLAAADQWIMDGDLGPGDVPSVRLRQADTILLLDFSVLRCAWRAWRRGPEGAAFWRWLLTWRCRSKPALLSTIRTVAPCSAVYVLRSPRQLRHVLDTFAV